MSVTAKAVKMKALSPFLPDAPTLASLFAGAGVVAPAESGDRERSSRPRATGTSPPVTAKPAAASVTPIRFPVSGVAQIPSKGPLRASIPPLDGAVASASGVHTIPARSATIPPANQAAVAAAVHATSVATSAATSNATSSAAAPLPAEQLSDEAALQLIFGRRDRGAPPLQQRFEAFVEWLATGVGAQASFVADVDGLVLANRNVPETYVVATASLSHAEQSVLDYMPRPQEGTTALELDETRYLQVIRVDSVVGRLIVGAIVTTPLNRTICAMVRRLLRIGVEWEAVR